ncbi:MAG: glycosyltransferase family 4 protein [Chloroflexi bacterium]|nr:glycosyltransferase family 4 protein [Chloroflexota bacterium]
MKILHVFDYFSPARGGGTVTLLYRLCQAQAARGHEVSIYASDFELDQNYANSLKGVKVHLFHLRLTMGGFFFMPEMARAVRDHLREFDVVHLHVARSYQNILIQRYAGKYGVPYVLDAHGSTPRVVGGRKGFKYLLKWLFDIAYGNNVFRNACKLVAETDVGVSEYKELGLDQGKIVKVPPSFSIQEFSRLPARGVFRDKYGIKEKHVVLFLGRIHWVKGVDFLVESFGELVKSRDDVRLVIVGPDDGHKTKLEQLIKNLNLPEKVLFTGFLDGSDKLSAFVDADVLVQTSVIEQGAWVPFEALLCGAPIIVTKHTGAGEDVRKYDAGYLVEYQNKTELANLIQYIIDNPDEARKKAAEGRERVKANLSLEKNVENYEALYRSCLPPVARASPHR